MRANVTVSLKWGVAAAGVLVFGGAYAAPPVAQDSTTLEEFISSPGTGVLTPQDLGIRKLVFEIKAPPDKVLVMRGSQRNLDTGEEDSRESIMYASHGLYRPTILVYDDAMFPFGDHQPGKVRISDPLGGARYENLRLAGQEAQAGQLTFTLSEGNDTKIELKYHFFLERYDAVKARVPGLGERRPGSSWTYSNPGKQFIYSHPISPPASRRAPDPVDEQELAAVRDRLRADARDRDREKKDYTKQGTADLLAWTGMSGSTFAQFQALQAKQESERQELAFRELGSVDPAQWRRDTEEMQRRHLAEHRQLLDEKAYVAWLEWAETGGARNWFYDMNARLPAGDALNSAGIRRAAQIMTAAMKKEREEPLNPRETSVQRTKRLHAELIGSLEPHLSAPQLRQFEILQQEHIKRRESFQERIEIIREMNKRQEEIRRSRAASP
jgi:hypothetical protein